MRARDALPIVFILLAATAAAAVAQARQAGSPRSAIKTVAAIPVFAGAKRVASEKTDREGWEAWSSAMKDKLDSLRSEEVVTYEVLTHPENVYDFYRDKLGGQQHRMWSDFDYSELARGATTVIWRYPRFWIKPTTKTKAIFANRPVVDKPDQWLCFATFMWLVREQSGDVSGIMVSVRDAGTVRAEGIAKDPVSYSPRARIVIKRATWVDPDKVPGKFGLPEPSPFYCF